jgi:hypothetical protein
MRQVRVIMLSLSIVVLCGLLGQAQQSVATATNATVPPLIQFSNVATDEGGTTLSGVVSITFSLYSSQQGGEPLWTETHSNVQLDASGHYSVQLGITKPNGVPTTLFTTGEARWLGVQIAEQAERARVLLLSVPYALKAGDAATIGGLPPSAFVLAAPGTASISAPTTFVESASSSDAPAGSDVTGSGTADFIPLWTTTSNIGNSALFQSGTGTTAKVGINTTTPASTLDVKGGGTVRGTLSLPTNGTATATAGKNSQPLTLAASAFNSTTSTAVNQVFQWQAEPASNDTAAPSGTLNLLFGEGATRPSETGLKFASNGVITFATGQSFPGTGDGTITAVTAGTGLTGGGQSGGVTLNVDTTKIPQLAAANTFIGNQTATGNLTATGVVSGSSYQIGSNLFAFGSFTNGNAYLGFAGNSNPNSGTWNTASGINALFKNTTGFENTASGSYALFNNSTGYANTASGYNALTFNTTGEDNTGVGDYAGSTADASALTGKNNTALGTGTQFSTGTLTNATAIGAWAEVAESNAIVLGSINGVNGQTANTSVGIGTTTPQAKLDVEGNSVQTLIGDPGCGSGFAGLGFVGSGGFSSCKNYALIGDLSGNTYIGSSGNGIIHFRNQNGADLMTIDPSGDVSIKGSLSKGSGSFKIDHPLDPANKYLYHSFVESPDMMNVYNGLATLDAHGAAWITLPTYFEALNRNFRYQLTSIGRPQPSLYIAREVSGNRFRISGGKPAGKVSWQVTGIRHDAYADANRIQVEVEKPSQEQGHYLHPELFGAQPQQAVGDPAPRSVAGPIAGAPTLQR